MKHSRTKMLILAVLFVLGTAIGCRVEFRPLTSSRAGIFALPGIFFSLVFGIGPHGSTSLYLWTGPLCNGVAYAAPIALAFW
jgi:hypothetical protein